MPHTSNRPAEDYKILSFRVLKEDYEDLRSIGRSFMRERGYRQFKKIGRKPVTIKRKRNG